MMGFMATVVWFLVVGRRWYRSAVPTLVLCVLLVGVVNKPQTYLLVAKAAKADICPIVKMTFSTEGLKILPIKINLI